MIVELEKRVDLMRLTERDFRLSGELRMVDGPYAEWDLKPEFKVRETDARGTDAYVPLDDLFPERLLHLRYELIVQTPSSSHVLDRGYLHRRPRGSIFLGQRDPQLGGYVNSSPVFFALMDHDTGRPLFDEPIDIFLIQVPSGHYDKDAERQRVLYD